MWLVSLKALVLQKMDLGRWANRHYPPAHAHSGGVSGDSLNPQALLWNAS